MRGGGGFCGGDKTKRRHSNGTQGHDGYSRSEVRDDKTDNKIYTVAFSG